MIKDGIYYGYLPVFKWKNNVEQIEKIKLRFTGRINIGLIGYCDKIEKSTKL